MAKTNKVDLSEVFQDGDVPTGQDFKNLISSSLNLNETGSTIQVLSSSLIVSGALNVTGSISCSGNIEGDSFTVRGLTFIDTTTHSTTESVSFGDSASIDQHRFTGSVFITGSDFDVIVSDSGSISFSTTSGSITFDGTSSFAGPINRFTGSLEVSASANSYLSGGKLGIGTPIPEHTLEVTTVGDKVVNGSNIIAKFHGDYAGNQGLMVSRSNGSSVKLLAGHSTYGGGLESSDALRFSTNGRNHNTCSLYIETDNKVALGTLVQGNYLLESPQATLHIKETPATNGTTNLLVLDGWTATDITTDPRAIALEFRGGDDNSYASGSIRLAYVHDADYGYTGGNQESNGNLIFATTPDHTGITDKMILTGTGNLGIGTLAPTAKLAVVGDISSSGAIISASGQVTASKLMLTGNELNIGGGIFTSASLAAGGGDPINPTFLTGSFTSSTTPPLGLNKLTNTGDIIDARFNNNTKFKVNTDGDILTTGDINIRGKHFGTSSMNSSSRTNDTLTNNIPTETIGFASFGHDKAFYLQGGPGYDGYYLQNTGNKFRIKVKTEGPRANANIFEYQSNNTDTDPEWRGVIRMKVPSSHFQQTNASMTVFEAYHLKRNFDNSPNNTKFVRAGIGDRNSESYTTDVVLHVHGKIKHQGVVEDSDERLKENIKPLESQLNNIKQLKPSKFDWKDQTKSCYTDDVGFIAQEIRNILPILVTGDESEGDMLSVNYSKLTPILVKAIQEQQEIIESLTKRIEDLENK